MKHPYPEPHPANGLATSTGSSVNLEWATPNGDAMIVRDARVSNPAKRDEPGEKLIAFCIRNHHVSIFGMANMCLEIETTRDIARQMLRHSSFQFQEFSQRYAAVSLLGGPIFGRARMQDRKNRQSSNPCESLAIRAGWHVGQRLAWNVAYSVYRTALWAGVAKEVARKVLPEGLTPSRLHMNGTVRSWIFFCKVRMDKSTQLEHREIAHVAFHYLEHCYPIVVKALKEEAERLKRFKKILSETDFENFDDGDEKFVRKYLEEMK